MGKGGAAPPANTTTSTTPWSGAQPYLTGARPRPPASPADGSLPVPSRNWPAPFSLPGGAAGGGGGTGGQEGIFPAASRFFEEYQDLNPLQEELRAQYADHLMDRFGELSGNYGADRFREGEFDPWWEQPKPRQQRQPRPPRRRPVRKNRRSGPDSGMLE